MDTLGGRIKKWRGHLNLSQSEFAKTSGIPLPTLKGYELGHRTPGSEALTLISNTGANVDWLLTGNGNMAQLPDSPSTKMPDDLADFQDSMKRIFDLLLRIDEGKRETAINEMLARVQDAARISELERMVQNLQKD